MNPLGTRARADELARLLDDAGPVDGSAAPYAALVERMRAVGTELAPVSAPRAEFRAALRTRLVAVASVQAAHAAAPAAPRPTALEAAVSWSRGRRVQRGMGLAAGAMASIVAVAGVAVAGSQSLPGDPFYGVKRGGEALELRTTHGSVARGSKHLEFAAERLKEVRELSLGRDAAFSGAVDRPVAAAAFGGSTGTRVLEALADMDRETRAGSDLLTAAYRASNDDAPLEILSRFAGQQSRDLQELLPSIPSSARPRAAESLALVSGVAVDASQLLAVGVCTGQCNPTQSAPALPPATGGPAPQPGPSQPDAPCGCQPAPSPTPTTAPAPDPGSTTPTPSPTPQPTASPSSPAPKPTSSPTPLPVPVPSTPVPLPTLPPLPLPSITPSPLGLPALPTLPAVPGVTTP